MGYNELKPTLYPIQKKKKKKTYFVSSHEKNLIQERG